MSLIRQLITNSHFQACAQVVRLGMENLVFYASSDVCVPVKTRMWADAQRDGRPAKYRWCPL